MTDTWLKLVNTSFPTDPIPAQFFRKNLGELRQREIPSSLKNRISGKTWKAVTMLDWRMTSGSPQIDREYIEPLAFIYYLPSILVGGVRYTEFIDFSLKSLLPHNTYHVPRGQWWAEFFRCMTKNQHLAINAYLTHVRSNLGDIIGPANQALLADAENIWSYKGI